MQDPRVQDPRARWARTSRACGAALLLLLPIGAACGDGSGQRPDAGPDTDTDGGAQAAFPEDFAQRYHEMRDCRHSHEHELRYIRVLASESAREPYAQLSSDAPYPLGATLVKLEYDDADCTALTQYTVLQKLAKGASPEGGDWLWQRVSPEREVLEQGAPLACVNCHTHHCAPPRGYDLTCAEEL